LQLGLLPPLVKSTEGLQRFERWVVMGLQENREKESASSGCKYLRVHFTVWHGF